ncbi:MAG: hypothetical protein SOR95_08185 [Sutterella sp.]|nr:hypothetical protein [Sutterella sp.]
MTSSKDIKGSTAFVRQLRRIMLRHGLLQKDFGRICKMPDGVLALILGGFRSCSVKNVDRIAEGLRFLKEDPAPFYSLAEEHNRYVRDCGYNLTKGKKSCHEALPTEEVHEQRIEQVIDLIRVLDDSLDEVRQEFNDIRDCLQELKRLVRRSIDERMKEPRD